MIHYIDELDEKDLRGKKVLLRLDLNVPIVDGKVADDFDIKKVIPTIDFLQQKEAKTIIIAHAENKFGKNESLLPMNDYLRGYFPVDFCSTYFSDESKEKLLNLKDKGVLLLENIRGNPEEKENNDDFAKKLSEMADIYVNDAFGVSHREHASIVSLPKFLPHYGGFLMREEINHLSRVFNPERPFVFILGGAKFDTKLPIIQKYLERTDFVFVGGALANNIFKTKGFELGTSLVGPVNFDIREMIQNPKLIIPVDVTVTNPKRETSLKNANEVANDECIVDAGPKTLKEIEKILVGVKTIVWNGPLGNYEIGFSDKTESLAEIIAKVTANGAESIIGGGDTIASIDKLGLNDKFSFVSTGGGAMLDFLVDETLPGIEALKTEN